MPGDEMRSSWLAAVLMVGLSLPAGAQTGLTAEGFLPAAGARDLLAARSPGGGENRVSASLGMIWDWRVLGLRQEQGTTWTVKQRVAVFGGAEAWATPSLRLGLFASGAAWQQGTRTDSFGQAGPLSAGMGEAWLSALARLVDEQALRLGFELGLRFPSAADQALAGEPSAGSRFAVLLEFETGPVRTLLNAALVGRRRTFFRDLERASAWQAVLGVELEPESWPVTPAVELFVERALWPSSGYDSVQLEVFSGGHLRLGGYSLALGAAAGVLGAGAPAARVVFRLGWSGCRSCSRSE